MMEKEVTSRGFVRFEFTDRNNEKCSMQKSSIATEGCIWLGTDKGERMHLTQKNVKKLLPLLQTFAETGDLVLRQMVPDHFIKKYPLTEKESVDKMEQEKIVNEIIEKLPFFKDVNKTLADTIVKAIEKMLELKGL